MKKNFIFDTNVLLHDPRAIFKFKDNHVIIPIYVIEEVDTFKRELTELGRNAREISRLLDQFRESGNLGEGIKLDNGGTLRVAFTNKKPTKQFLHSEKKDNLILGVALEIQENEPDMECILISKDTNLRVRADALGLKSENYEEADIVAVSELYPGACELHVSDSLINDLHQHGEITLDLASQVPYRPVSIDSSKAEKSKDFYTNEFVLLRGDSPSGQTSLGRLTIDDEVPQSGVIKPLNHLREQIWGIRARNKEQAFALDALLDDSISLVTLIGKAGTGKTLLAIAAGLRKVTDEQTYHKLVVSRPVIPMGRDLGYLPGTVEEKLDPWMRPIFDNVEYLMGITRADKRAGRGADELRNMGIIDIEPLTYIRGRSMPNLYMVIDEAQNLTPHEVKTILTRAGEGTKIVLTGDPYQIDNPYVDSESNGLSYLVNRFKGQQLASTVTLFKGERSELAELAANIL